ncbi:hypothetical protein L873DRAFT_1665140, partial [Choiromyces venosus 120613-1]
FIIKRLNRVWSINGHDKLSYFSFKIYTAINSYSCFIIWYFVGHSNYTALSVNEQYLLEARELGIILKLIYSSKVTETILLVNSYLIICHAYEPDIPLSRACSYSTSIKNI